MADHALPLHFILLIIFIKVCDELEAESQTTNTNLLIVKISCKYIQSWNQLIELLGSSFPGTETTRLDLKTAVLEQIWQCSGNNRYLILALTKIDELLSSDFANQFTKLCLDIINNKKNVFIILSSQINVNVSQQFKTRHVSLEKLDTHDAISLLQLAATDVDFSGSEKRIVNGCHRIPGLIIEVANILAHHESILNGDSLAELLSDPKSALTFFSSTLGPSDGQLKVKLEKLLKRLPSELVNTVNDLSLLQGSFCTKAIQAVLGHKHECDTNIQVILLRDASVIEFDKETHLFSFNPLLKAYMALNSAAMPCSDLAKLRFVKFFVDTMITVDQKLYKNSHKNIKDYFHSDYENVCQVMQHAIHCSENIFQALMQVGSCTCTFNVGYHV